MREQRLIKEGCPCDTDFTDESIQTVADAKAKGRVFCPNHEECKRRSPGEVIQCIRRIAQQMAGYIIESKESFEKAILAEKNDFLEQGPDGKFWVCDGDGNWKVVSGKENVIDDIVAFARIIIDMKKGEHRSFTKDGMKIPEMGPSDAVHNALLDLDDVYGEIGEKNPFRPLHEF